MTKLKAITAVLFCALVLTGCYDDREIDETAYIIAIGIDLADSSDTTARENAETEPNVEKSERSDAEKTENTENTEKNEKTLKIDKGRAGAASEGVTDGASAYKYTFQFAAPLAVSGEGGGAAEAPQDENGSSDSGNSGVRNVVVTASDFYVAKNMLNNFLSKNIDMSHLKMIVFSPKVERDGYISHSQLFLHEREVRPHTCLAVAECSAEELLRSVNPELELNTAKYYELMALRSNNVYAPVKLLRDFADDSSENGRDTVLPIARISNKTDVREKENGKRTEDSAWITADGVRVSSSRSDMRGMAVFRNSEPVGETDGDGALVYNILTGGIKKCNVSLRNEYSPENTISFAVSVPKAAHIEAEENNGKYIVTMKTRLGIKYINERLPKGYRSYGELYDYACSEFEKKFSEFLYSSSRDFGADIFGIGKKLRRKYADTERLEGSGTKNIYSTAEFNVIVDML